MASVPPNRHLGRAMLLAPPSWTRVARFVLMAWLLALGGIVVAQQAHAGLHERVELSLVAHLLRDASLAVPFAAASLAIGGLGLAAWARRFHNDPASLAGLVVWVVITAFVFAALSIPGNQLHGVLFGAEEEAGEWLADVLLDSGGVLVGALLVLLPAALIRLAPWPPGGIETAAVTHSQHVVLAE